MLAVVAIAFGYSSQQNLERALEGETAANANLQEAKEQEATANANRKRAEEGEAAERVQRKLAEEREEQKLKNLRLASMADYAVVAMSAMTERYLTTMLPFMPGCSVHS